MIIAGEASGDLHGANLIHELRILNSNLEIFGIGGDKMIAEGLNSIYHINQMAFLGFVEVIKHLPFIRKVRKKIISTINERDIKTIVLIDYPGFNLSLANSLKKLKLNIIYYISPQIWAWGKNRIKKIKRLINKIIVFFPFEKIMYDNFGINAEYVGHPLVNLIDNFNFISKAELYKRHNLDNDKDILLIMPGSRIQELEKIFPQSIKAANKICNKFNMQTIVACADNIDENFFENYFKMYSFKVVKGDTYNLIKNAKFSIIKSGTSTLEAGIIGNPFAVVYVTNPLTYYIGKLLIKIKNISLANIVAEKEVVKEFIQNEVNAENIFIEVSKILENNVVYENIKKELAQLKNKLISNGDPNKKAAEIIYKQMDAE